MSLYDNVKLNNSTFISQYVGSVVPELAQFSQTMQRKYNEARDTDDALTEALGNLQHLQLEGDTQYANELKQKYVNSLSERAAREDYENMGRRTRRDAMRFSVEYQPLVQRQKDYSTIMQRVEQDDKIFDPTKKAQIRQYIGWLNNTQKDPVTGDFMRDENGKVKLNAVQDWSYAKDVDINKKLADLISKKQAEVRQSGYSSDGSGLKVSTKTEKLTQREIARMAQEMMQTDPEIRAMIERDVTLSTYHLSPEQVNKVASSAGASRYTELKRQGYSDEQIKAFGKAAGQSMEEMKTSPIDTMRKQYIQAGRNPLDADREFVRNLSRQQIMNPYKQFIAELLEIDKQTIEAREDGAYTAKLLAETIKADQGDAIPIVSGGGEAEDINVESWHQGAVDSNSNLGNIRSALQSRIGSVMGLINPATLKDKKALDGWYNNTQAVLGNEQAQLKMVNTLKSQGRHQEAADLEVGFRKYKAASNQVIIAQKQLAQVREAFDPRDLYERYQKRESMLGHKPLSYTEFRKDMESKPLQKEGFFFGNGDKLSEYRHEYFNQMQKKAEEMHKAGTIQKAFTTLEPAGPGKIANQTKMLEDALRSGTMRGTDLMTGESWEEIIRKELGSGWPSKSISDSDRKDPKSDYNKAMNLMSARFNMEPSSDGKMTATIKLPNGKEKIITLDNIHPTLGNEMKLQFAATAAKHLSKSDATHLMKTAYKGLGVSTMNLMNEADLATLKPSATIHPLNDNYGVRVMEAGIGSYKDKVYKLMVKNPNGKWEASSIKPGDYHTILGLMGQEKAREDSPDGGNNNPFR